MALLTEPGQAGKGKREDLSDLIALIDIKDTPFVSMARKGMKLGNSLFRWQADSYAAPSLAGVVDGVDVDTARTSDGTFPEAGSIVPENPAAGRAELSNYGQYRRRAVRVTPLAEEVQVVAGVPSELARGVRKKMTELKRDMEFICLGTADGQADNGTVPYLTKQLGQWLTVADGTPAIPAAFQVSAANILSAPTTATLADSDIQGLLKAIYDITGQIRTYDAFLGTALKRAWTDRLSGPVETVTATEVSNSFGIVRTFNQDATSKQVVFCIDFYQGDFGRIRIHPSVFVNEAGTPAPTNGYICPMDLAEIRYGILPRAKNLTNNGGGEGRLLETFFGLCIHDPRAFGKIDLAS
jgi:hypothetical protein